MIGGLLCSGTLYSSMVLNLIVDSSKNGCSRIEGLNSTAAAEAATEADDRIDPRCRAWTAFLVKRCSIIQTVGKETATSELLKSAVFCVYSFDESWRHNPNRANLD